MMLYIPAVDPGFDLRVFASSIQTSESVDITLPLHSRDSIQKCMYKTSLIRSIETLHGIKLPNCTQQSTLDHEVLVDDLLTADQNTYILPQHSSYLLSTSSYNTVGSTHSS